MDQGGDMVDGASIAVIIIIDGIAVAGIADNRKATAYSKVTCITPMLCFVNLINIFYPLLYYAILFI